MKFTVISIKTIEWEVEAPSSEIAEFIVKLAVDGNRVREGERVLAVPKATNVKTTTLGDGVNITPTKES